MHQTAAAGVEGPRLGMELAGPARGAIDPHSSRRYLESGSARVDHPVAPAKGGLTAWRLRRVKSLVEEGLDGALPVRELAVAARLSPAHFCRAFKISTGETPHAYIVRQRVRRAQTLMLASDDRLSEIACACGLTDQAHLSRLFRKLVGCTPLAWRRAWRSA